MKKFLIMLGASFMWVALIAPANAGTAGIGIAFTVGEADTSGTETEKAVTGVTSESTSTAVKKVFAGASVYAEFRTDNGFTLGLDYVPMDIELGAEKRSDSESGASTAGADDSGDRTASADITDLYTVYAHVPVGPVYVLLGWHTADIRTTESLPTSKYGNISVNGLQYGLGIKNESNRFRAEVAYSDFDAIALTATGNTIAGNLTGQNKITADADALTFKIAVGF